LHGRRDNKYKARIKILVHETGLEDLQAQIEAEWQVIKDSDLKLPEADIAAINAYFAAPALPERAEGRGLVAATRKNDVG
ncbi:nitrite/sulfite reductase, partial [Ochrobactrum sp. GRS2]|nr:nitrite/sulfite reductase [Ochrobactrum sp. GRS2]